MLRGGGSSALMTSLEKPWPNLKVLELRRISLPWSYPLVSNLAHLALERVTDLSFGILVEILRSSPQLEELKLTSIGPSMDLVASHVNLSAALVLPSLRLLQMRFLSGDLLHRILNLIEPHHLETLSLCQDSRQANGSFSMPSWSVPRGVEMLQRNNTVRLYGGDCTNSSSGFNISASPEITLPWLARVLDLLPDSTPSTAIACHDLTFETLINYFPHQLDRCELTLKPQWDCLGTIQSLCRRLPSGTFPFPTLVELSIRLGNETTANAIAELLKVRYSSPTEVTPLRKLMYTTRSGASIASFNECMSVILKDCALNWGAVPKFNCDDFGARSSDNRGYSDDDAVSD